MTDDELYRQYLAGERAAFDELILRYSDMLTAYVNAFLHNAQDAEDVMLDSFAAIVLNKPEIAEGRFRAYLFTTARNKANRLWRVRFRRQEFSLDEQEAETILSPVPEPEAAILQTERSAALQRCLNRIAPQYREALFLVYAAGLSYAQAAEIRGMSTGQIHSLLDEGKKRMRRELEKEGITDVDT